MEIWKRNLIVCWFGAFVTAVGMSQLAPVLPLYIKQLGISDVAKIEQWSGIAFGVTFIVSAIFSPIWGHVADKFGRKSMLLRASLGMSIVIFFTGFVQNIYQLIGLRLLQGVISGYITTCTTLIATQTDKEHAGWALGTLSTAQVAGSLLGPMVGGYLEVAIGVRSVFFIVGALLMIAFITTLIFVKEQFTPSDKKTLNSREVWRGITNHDLIITIFVTSFILQLALYSIEPIMTVYVGQLAKNTVHVALISGVAFSASGLASILSAPRLGRLADNIGCEKVMLAALIISGVLFVPQAFVRTPWQLMMFRFMLGVATAGLLPSINALIKLSTPDSLAGRVFGFNIAAQYLGIFSGSILGGQVAAHFGIQNVFFMTSILLLTNAMWVYKKAYKKVC